MNVAEVLTEIEALPQAERAQVAQETLRSLDGEFLKVVERTLRRLTHPEVPEEVWEGYEDAEDGRFVDPAMILREEPPQR